MNIHHAPQCITGRPHGRQSVFDAERSGQPCELLSGKRDLCAKIVTEE
jgi:hypothetical protein